MASAGGVSTFSGATGPAADAAPSHSRLPSVAPLSKYKVVFLGDQGTGKTSIIKSFMFDSFDHTYAATIGIDFLSKTLYLDDRTVRLQIWDSAGQERFRSLIPSYIRDSSVAVVVYDVTNRTSFANVSRWVEDVRSERGTDVVIMIVGNKTDLADRRQVSTDEGERVAREQGVLFIETSAKANYNIKGLFKQLATTLPGSVAAAPVAAESNLIDIRLQSVPPSEKASAAVGGCLC